MEHYTQDFIVEEIEHALCEISEIQAVRVVTDGNNTIQEIHVLASSAKEPKQLVRDVESTLMARFGIPVNHRKISVAQLDKEEIVKERARPRVVSVNSEVGGIKGKFSVVLALDGSEYEGIAEGPISKSGWRRLLGIATLDAIEKFAPGSYGFALEDIAVVSLGNDKVAVACIAVVTPVGEQTFAGSALIKRSEKDAVVRAVLDAINRRFSFLTTA